MTKKQYFEVGVWLSLSIFLGIKSIQLDLGTLSSPGPGFVVFILAVLLLLLSLGLLIEGNLLRKSFVQRPTFGIRSLCIVCLIIGYVLIFRKLGYLFSTFLLMTLIFRLMGTKRWVWALGEAMLATLLSYLVFEVALKLNLPPGIF